MTKEIRRYELVEDTSDEEAGKMKAQMRVEEAQRLRRARQEQTAKAASAR
ncbi:hypothetical protein [Paracoccus luteus]|nr:hypothetical protein [Paracoccus luteus]